MRAATWLVCIWLSFGAQLARADTIALLPVRAEGIPESVSQEVQETILMVLQAGSHVIRRPVVSCDNPECAAQVAATLEAARTIAPAIWRYEGGYRIAISIVLPNGTEFFAEANVTGDAGEAARSALSTANARYQRGEGPWLIVESSPEGAAVYVDDVRVGETPWIGRIEPGVHEVRIERDEHRTVERTVHARPEVWRETLVTTELEPTRRRRSRGGQASPWNYILGAAGVFGATLFAVKPVRTLARRGDCVGDCTIEDGNYRAANFGWRSSLSLITSVGLLAGSITLFILRPIRVTATVDTAGPRLSLEF